MGSSLSIWNSQIFSHASRDTTYGMDDAAKGLQVREALHAKHSHEMKMRVPSGV